MRTVRTTRPSEGGRVEKRFRDESHRKHRAGGRGRQNVLGEARLLRGQGRRRIGKGSKPGRDRPRGASARIREGGLGTRRRERLHPHRRVSPCPIRSGGHRDRIPLLDGERAGRAGAFRRPLPDCDGRRPGFHQAPHQRSWRRLARKMGGRPALPFQAFGLRPATAPGGCRARARRCRLACRQPAPRSARRLR